MKKYFLVIILCCSILVWCNNTNKVSTTWTSEDIFSWSFWVDTSILGSQENDNWLNPRILKKKWLTNWMRYYQFSSEESEYYTSRGLPKREYHFTLPQDIEQKNIVNKDHKLRIDTLWLDADTYNFEIKNKFWIKCSYLELTGDPFLPWKGRYPFHSSDFGDLVFSYYNHFPDSQDAYYYFPYNDIEKWAEKCLIEIGSKSDFSLPFILEGVENMVITTTIEKEKWNWCKELLSHQNVMQIKWNTFTCQIWYEDDSWLDKIQFF